MVQVLPLSDQLFAGAVMCGLARSDLRPLHACPAVGAGAAMFVTLSHADNRGGLPTRRRVFEVL